MRRINLLPPEILSGRKARQEGSVLAIVFGGVVFVLALVWLVLHIQLKEQQDRLASAQARAQSLQVQINSLQRFAVLEQSINARVTTLAGAMTNDIGWSRLLRDVSNIIPANSWLTAFTGTAEEAAAGAAPGAPPAATPAAGAGTPGGATGVAGATAAGAPAGAAPGGVPAAPGAPVPLSPGAAAAAGTLPPRLGTLTFTAVTFDFPGVAQWITTLEQLGSLQNIFVPTATKEALVGREVVNFTSTADLSQAARSGRYQKRP